MEELIHIAIQYGRGILVLLLDSKVFWLFITEEDDKYEELQKDIVKSYDNSGFVLFI